MKLLRYGPPGREKPGVLDAAGRIRDLSGALGRDLDSASLAAGILDTIYKIDVEQLPLVEGQPRIGPPVGDIRKLIGIGLNYSDHAAESGMPVPKEPIVFMKASSCICGPDDDVLLPRGSKKLDWEVELGIVIGKQARYVEKANALDHVAGYCLVNDVSEREFQLEKGGTWDKGKSFDTFGPIGPWLVTRDEVPEPQRLDMWLDVNGQRMQSGNTRTMVFDCATLVSYVSQFMTLQPGDVISTGTPPGVGMGRKPEPVYLKAGDTMELGIDGLGRQRQLVKNDV
jgi:2-keto-4-pentenoate hydratase/2-oxohepta-3-ene-1,7-dioic acid hydratase in catechol pathway